MEIRIIKIDGEFAVVEVESSERMVCPTFIFPKEVQEDDVVIICIKEK